jgi:hypothetical protein
MHRPIGVTILAALSGLVGLLELWRAAVFMGWVSWTFVGKEVSFQEAQWGQVIWALILAAIWFWVAMGFWNVRAYAWSFGNFIALFTLIFGFFAVLGSSTLEAESAPIFVALIIFMYLNYPGVRDQFIQHEMSLMTPEQRAALAQMQAANAAAMGGGTPPAPPAAPPAPPAAPPPAAPPTAPPSA